MARVESKLSSISYKVITNLKLISCNIFNNTCLFLCMQEYIRREVKPHFKDELVQGIQQFWGSVSVQKCRRYIGHLRKVLPRIVELEGAATGY